MSSPTRFPLLATDRRRSTMKRPLALAVLLASILLASLAAAQGLPTAAPEDVGLSSAGLAKVTAVVNAEIAKGRYPGAVALVARRGKGAHLQGVGPPPPHTAAPPAQDATLPPSPLP